MPIADVTFHAYLAHVQPNLFHRGLLQYSVDALHAPGSRRPRVLVQEVSLVLDLVRVEVAAKLHMSLGFGKVLVEVLNPTGLVLVHLLIQLLEHREIGAWWTPYNKQWLVTMYDIPCSLPVSSLVKVKTIG